MASFTFGSIPPTATASELPAVRIEVRHGKSAPSWTEMTREEFLIGAAAGCELRLPGTNLPPVVCVLSRQTDSVRLKKVAQNTPVLLNGQPVSNSNLALLSEGDILTIGRTDIHVHIEMNAILPSPIVEEPILREPETYRVERRHSPATTRQHETGGYLSDSAEGEFRRRLEELNNRERQLRDAEKELEADRVLWYRRRDEMEKEHRRLRTELAGDAEKKKELEERYEIFERRHVELADWREKLHNHQNELERARLELQQRQHDLQNREKDLAEDWDQRRKLLEDELAQRRKLLEDELAQRRQTWEQEEARLRTELENDLVAHRASFDDEIAAMRKELATKRVELDEEFSARRADLEAELIATRQRAETEWRIWIEQKDTGYAQFREQLEWEIQEKFRKRGEELDRFQLTVREAAVQLREVRNIHQEQVNQFEPRWKELLKREEEAEARHRSLDERHREWKNAQAEVEGEQLQWLAKVRQQQENLEAWEARLKEREEAIGKEAASADELKAKFQTNLIRLGELQLELDEKDKRLAGRAADVDSHWERFRQETANFVAQAQELDERRGNLILEEQEFKRRLREIEDREASLHPRMAQLETQQGLLANLRMKLEAEREETQREAARVAEEREKQDRYLQEAREKLREAELLRESLADQRLNVTEGNKVFEERSEMMRQAMMQLRALQDQLADKDEDVRRREEELARKQATIAEEAALWRSRAEQLADQARKLDEDRAALRVRESDLLQADEPRRLLQEQLRKRSEELAGQQRELSRKADLLDEQTKLLQEQADALEALRADAIQARSLSETHYTELVKKDQELRQCVEELRQAQAALALRDKELAGMNALLAQDRRLSQDQSDEVRQRLNQYREELVGHAAALQNEIPEFEARLQSSLDKTAQIRDQLRGQLGELHTYARQSQEELQAIRDQLAGEREEIRTREAELNRTRAEHRHSVASFKQQLLEWQTRFSDLKQTLARNQSAIGRKEAVIEVTALELAHKSEQLERDRKIVSEQRSDVERHLKDMRQWYRSKLRELVEGKRSRDSDSLEPSILPLTSREASKPVRLEELDSADRKLGEMLRTYDLVDSETLNALWTAAKNSRKPLRQVLLATNALTVYQMALIEAGNIDGLVLGRFRVIDRLPGTPREAQFKVYDPQGLADSRRAGQQGPEGICLLRHLSESEMANAVHPDEYRERYRAARDLAHPNIRATYEVLDIAGRPAVLQEWSVGLPGDEWPVLAAAPGVWFRLLSQAGLALYTAAQAGLHHGRLRPESFWLTRDGIVKADGFGEPNWIFGSSKEPTAQGDLLALGQAAVFWADLNKRRKKFPESLQQILARLGADENAKNLYTNASELLDDLDKAGAGVPINGDIWDKLLQHIEEHEQGEGLRQSA